MSDLTKPIAIVGASCRFPGGSHDLESLWQALTEERATWSNVPPDRYREESFYHPSRASNASHTHRGGHFLNQDVGAFDAAFFGISSEEASAIDPQQRIQLEIAYEALENAGIPLAKVQGSNTGVYVATFMHDYENMMFKDVNSLPRYSMTGTGLAIVSNRISYTFDLKGPSMTLDTGCSGSLVALHQACQSLRIGETNMALVGGTNLILSPDPMIPMDMLHLLNADGRCYSFDSRGSGYGRGEGVAMVVLKRLDAAIQAGDAIRSVIRNTAVGQDGKTAGITLPSGKAQLALIRSAYGSVSLDPNETGYVEAHGTGTVAGDVTEMDAIEKAFCERRDNVIYVGSIKANIGHLESTSGLAGLLKTVLVLEKGLVPPTPNLIELKERLRLMSDYIKIPQSLIVWPPNVPRRASVNSFGYGGTNAHAILDGVQEWKCNRTWRDEKRSDRFFVVAVTARSEKSLMSSLGNLRRWVKAQPSVDYVADLAYTLASRRSLMHWRCSFVVSNHQDLLDVLESESPKGTRTANINRLTYVFTGQGAQWYAMARELLEIPSFMNSVAESSVILKGLGASWDLLEEVTREKAASRVDQSEIGQPSTTAIQIGLVELFRSMGVKPNEVLGHSSGEIAAAFAGGGLSKSAAMEISYHRGFLSAHCRQLLGRKGAMLAVALGEQETRSYIDRIPAGHLAVACRNSPSSTTVSGDEGAIVQLRDSLARFAISARILTVDTAYHSDHMLAVAEKYMQKIKDVQHGSLDPDIKFYSSVTGREKTSDFGPSYWIENLVSKVRFFDAVQTVCGEAGSDITSTSCRRTFLELSPNDTLVGAVKQTITYLKLQKTRCNCISALNREKNSQVTFLHAVMYLFEQGYPVDLGAVNSFDDAKGQHNVITTLAPYPFDHFTSYWHESRLSMEHRHRPHPYHDLLGSRNAGDTLVEPTWRHIIHLDGLPWLRDHTVDDSIIFPASGYIAMAIEAKKQLMSESYPTNLVRAKDYILRDLVISKMLEIPHSPGNVEVHTTLRYRVGYDIKTADAWQEFRISSISSKGFVDEHCYGLIRTVLKTPTDDFRDPYKPVNGQANRVEEGELLESADSPGVSFDPNGIYEEMRSSGHHWGPTFSRIEKFVAGVSSAFGSLTVPDIAEVMPGGFMQPHVIHPATLDAIIHTGLIIYSKTASKGVMFPVAMGEVTISADIVATPGAQLVFATTLVLTGSSSAMMEVSASQKGASFENRPCVLIKSGEILGATGPNSRSNTTFADTCYQTGWAIDIERCTLPPATTHPVDNLAQERKISHLNTAALYYVESCLCSTEQINVEEQHAPYFRWMERLKSQMGTNRHQADIRDSLQLSQKAGIEGELLDRVGTNLKAILTGRSDPLQLLFQDDILSRYYAEDSASLQCHRHLIAYVKQLIFKKPRIKILEIGAGTGGATLPLLQTLSHRENSTIGEYTFTDVSSGFFEKSRMRLKEWSQVLYFKNLDIERDPLEQGFTAGYYDVVLAFNAMHVAKDLNNAISNAGKLLKAGGKLILIEITRLNPYVNAIFGLLPGWYSEHIDGRAHSPTISAEEWSIRLSQAPFNGVEVAISDYDGNAHQMTLMVSTSSGSDGLHQNSNRLILDPDGNPRDTASVRPFRHCLEKRSSFLAFEKQPLPEVDTESNYTLSDCCQNPLNMERHFKNVREQKNSLTLAKNVLWVVTPHEASDSTLAFLSNATVIKNAQARNKYLGLVTFEIGHYEDSSDVEAKLADFVSSSFQSALDGRPVENTCFYKDGQVLIPRLKSHEEIKHRVQLSMQTQFEELVFHQKDRLLTLSVEESHRKDGVFFVVDQKPDLRPSHIELRLQACRMTTGDGKSRQMPVIGEFAGIVTRIGLQHEGRFQIGDHVCGFARTPCANYVQLDGGSVHHLPKSLPFAVGACLPVAFITAYYGLVNLANLVKGQRILIHGATEAIGQAAVQIAQQIGAEVIVTVSSEQVPLGAILGVPQELVVVEDWSYAIEVQRLTNGSGVDVILAPSITRSPEKSYACLARFGRYIEVGKPDKAAMSIQAREVIGKNTLFASVDLPALCEYKSEDVNHCLAKIIHMFEREELRPLRPTRVLDISEIEDAFKPSEGSNIAGDVLLEAREGSQVKCVSQGPYQVKLCHSGTYVIAGDLGDLGLEVCGFLAARGANYVALIGVGVQEPEQQRMFVNELRRLGVNVRVIMPDLSNQLLPGCGLIQQLRDWPAVKAVIKADMLMQDPALVQLALHDLVKDQTLLSQSVNYLLGLQLDFFLELSSSVALLQNQSGNVWHAESSHNGRYCLRPEANHVSLFVGPIKGFGLASQRGGSQQTLDRKAFIPTEREELHALLDYAMVLHGKAGLRTQIVTGFDRRSLENTQYSHNLQSPLMNQLPQPFKPLDRRLNNPPAQVVEKSLVDAKSEEEAKAIVATALQHRISSFVAIEYNMIEIHCAIEDFGLDSLIVFRLRNWIFQNFRASLESHEISSAASILSLTGTILERTSLKVYRETKKVEQTARTVVDEKKSSSGDSAALLRQPLPLLDDSLQMYLDSARPFCSDNDFEKTRQAVTEFNVAGGMGQRLNARLVERTKDPQIENWLADLFLVQRYLRLRKSLVANQSYWGTHPMGRVPFGPAEKAAVISLAILQFKETLDSGELGPRYLYGQAMDQDSYQYLFNTCREPCVGQDRILKHLNDDYIVVFRYGRMFKIQLKDSSGRISFRSLELGFNDIIAKTPKEISWISALTMDERDSWAKLRQILIDTSDQNKTTIQIVEAAAFIVCLDDASPRNPEERFRQFLFGDGSNRWYDKTLQIIVCENGVSASLCEHSTLDGLSVEPLHEFINQAILDYDPQSHSMEIDDPAGNRFQYLYLPLTSTAVLNGRAQELRQTFPSTTSHFSFAKLEANSLGNDFLLSRKCPVQSGIQLAIQTASRQFFGYNPPALETVSMSHFRKGRVEVHHIVHAAMAKYLAAATDATMSRNALRMLAYDAAKEHARSLSRAVKGRGFSRHLMAMEWMLRDREVKPSLFEDPVYKMMKPGKMVTSTFRTGWLEGGFIYPVPGSILVYFEVKDQSVCFSIFGHDADATRFSDKLRVASEDISALLNEELVSSCVL